MIDLAKHSMHLGSGDVDIDVLESASGTPVIAFTNQYEDLSPANSVAFSWVFPMERALTP